MNDTEKMGRLRLLFDTGDLRQSRVLEEAYSIVLAIDDEEERDLELEKICVALAKIGELDEAKRAAAFIVHNYEKSETLIKIANALVCFDPSRKDVICDLLREAEQANCGALRSWQRADLFNNIAQSYQAIQMNKESHRLWQIAEVSAVEGIKSNNYQDQADSAKSLQDIAVALAESGDFQYALRIVQSLTLPNSRNRSLREIRAIRQGRGIELNRLKDFTKPLEILDPDLEDFCATNRFRVVKDVGFPPCRSLYKDGNPVFEILICQEDHWLDVDYNDKLPYTLSIYGIYRPDRDNAARFTLETEILETQPLSGIRANLQNALKEALNFVNFWTPDIFVSIGQRQDGLEMSRNHPGWRNTNVLME